MHYDQQEFELRLEWGLQGVHQLAPVSDVIIIADILSFSTCVDIAVARGATVYPYRWKDAAAVEYAASLDAILAGPRKAKGYSLSPASLLDIPSAARLVLPSPNGATLSLSTGHTPTLAGCFRNARAVAAHARTLGRRIAVIPAGEQWEDGSLRPSFEDLAGAGAILSYLTGSLSPEAGTALAAYHAVKHILANEMRKCSSGKELIARGFEQDLELACQVNVSNCVPYLQNKTAHPAYRNRAALSSNISSDG